jgi:hypothetical protein
MDTSIQRSTVQMKSTGTSRIAAVLRRAPLVMVTVIFTLISVRYLANPVQGAAAAGISFTSPGGITSARVGFAGFPLAFAILTVICLVSERRLLAGLYMVLTLDTVVIGVRIFGLILDHSAAESARLLLPEGVLLTLSIIAIHLERARR